MSAAARDVVSTQLIDLSALALVDMDQVDHELLAVAWAHLIPDVSASPLVSVAGSDS
jgi:hypothetical protein